MLNGMTNITSE